MKYFLSRDTVLKCLEAPCVYHIKNDELYELDEESFDFLKRCSESGLDAQSSEFTDYCLKENILTKDRVTRRQPPLAQSSAPSLRYLELQITNKCNLSCRHCYINLPLSRGKRRSNRQKSRGFSGRSHSELPVRQVCNLLEEFEEMQGLRVLITGGEPLLHSRFEEINQMLPQFFFRKVLFTNGVLLDKKRIKNLHVDEIQISIDGFETAHDTLRGKGTYSAAMKAVRYSLDYGFHVSIATMVHPRNLKDFDEMDSLFKGMGIKEWTVDIPCISGRLEENKDFQVTPETGGRYLKYGYGGGLHTSTPGFACGLHLMAVLADGKIAKCAFYSDNAVGRVEDGLRECWQRIRPIRIADLKCDCEYIESCRGGCRYRAGLLGNPLGKDLYRCAFYDLMPRECHRQQCCAPPT